MIEDLFTRLPPEGSQCRILLLALSRGEKLTMWDALHKYGIGALSQRAGELRRKYGWPVVSKMIQTQTGKHVAEYSLPAHGTVNVQDGRSTTSSLSTSYQPGA